MIHVYPTNDLRPHELEGTMCPCGPTVEWDHPEAIVIHRSWDGRELRERKDETPAFLDQVARMQRLGFLPPA